MRPVLMIIDMQNGFCHPKGSFGKMGFDYAAYRSVIPAIQDVLNYFRARRLPIYFTRAIREVSGIDCLDRTHKILPRSRRERIQHVPLCIRGSWDAEIIEELTHRTAEHREYIVEKRRDSAFQDTELGLWLRSLRVDTIVFTGIDSYICVESTLRDAFNRRYDVLLAEDAVASTRKDLHDATIESVRSAFGLVMTTPGLKEFLNQHVPPSKTTPAVSSLT